MSGISERCQIELTGRIGDKARDLLIRSKLPDDDLSQIW